MDLISLVLIVVVAMILVSLGKFLLHSIRALFYILLVALVVVFVFGISYMDLLGWAAKIVLWAF